MEDIKKFAKIYKTLANKDYFSAYLNMARHNVFITLSFLTEKLGKQIEYKRDMERDMKCLYIIDVLKNTENLETVNRAIKYLDEHFPFLKPIFYYKKGKDFIAEEDKLTDSEKKDIPLVYHEILCKVLDHLNNWRNFYTHHGHDPVTVDNDIFFYLDRIFDKSYRMF